MANLISRGGLYACDRHTASSIAGAMGGARVARRCGPVGSRPTSAVVATTPRLALRSGSPRQTPADHGPYGRCAPAVPLLRVRDASASDPVRVRPVRGVMSIE